jgi:hypothetical protein
MISRRTAAAIGVSYEAQFTTTKGSKITPTKTSTYRSRVAKDCLYDFLFTRDYSPWFCNSVKYLVSPRSLKEHIMRLHTGETQANATPDWDWDARRKLGQTYLHNLARDILNCDNPAKSSYSPPFKHPDERLLESLELDGYIYRDSRLIAPETDVLDTQEEAGVLATLFSDLGLDNWSTAKHCLDLSEEHWLNGKWDDCISNARRFMECVLQECAATHSQRIKKTPLAKKTYEQAAGVRDYLEAEQLLETREKRTIGDVYGLLSNVGSHPNIATKEQGRLLRQVALIFSQFVMLRLRGSLPT